MYSVSTCCRYSLTNVVSMQLFFAKVPPSASTAEVRQVFERFGQVQEVNLFRAWAGAKSSKVKQSNQKCAAFVFLYTL